MGRSLIDYAKFSGLADIYLEDSYVLEILEEPGKLTFKLDAVLTPENPAYQPPRPGEQYCYRTGRLVFPDAVRVSWLERTGRQFTDATGEHDLGNVDALTRDGTFLVAEGDWGRVRFQSSGPYFELDE